MHSRRFVPSTAALMAFEAAARLQSFTAAARELDLTQSAVSRQIKALEGQIGVALFVRAGRHIALTAQGARYAEDVRAGLDLISRASVALATNPDGGELNLAILPTFGTRWLAPKLPRFLDANPGVTVNLATRIRPFDFRAEPFDAAIHHGRPDWNDVESLFLAPETVIPACAPGFAAQFPMAAPADLLTVPRLQMATRPYAWPEWFAAQGIGEAVSGGMVFDQFTTLAQAAMAGLGVALLPSFLLQGELDRAELVIALNRPFSGPRGYHLVWPADRADFPPLRAFRQWLSCEAGATGIGTDRSIPGAA